MLEAIRKKAKILVARNTLAVGAVNGVIFTEADKIKSTHAS